MYYTYIIRSESHKDRLYTWFTEDLKQRLNDHNSGKSSHTKRYIPWKLEAYFAFTEKKTALDFEKYLKSASGIAFRNKRLIPIISETGAIG
jgi:putative endonuclease